jgi:hypothetical protein
VVVPLLKWFVRRLLHGGGGGGRNIERATGYFETGADWLMDERDKENERVEQDGCSELSLRS